MIEKNHSLELSFGGVTGFALNYFKNIGYLRNAENNKPFSQYLMAIIKLFKEIKKSNESIFLKVLSRNIDRNFITIYKVCTTKT